MSTPRVRRIVAAQTLVALSALAALAVVAGVQLAPGVPVPRLLLWAGLGAVLVAAAVLLAALASATLGQFILRRGGTDPQWFWFAAEPPGLLGLRQRLADLARAGAR